MSTTNQSRDSQEEQPFKQHSNADHNEGAPPYRRWPFEIEREERRVSPKPGTPMWHKDQRRDWNSNKQCLELKANKKRKQLIMDDGYDHHKGRSSAATHFLQSDVDDSNKNRYERMKSWNDGVRDRDRQLWEGEKDKLVWTDEFGARLELPSVVIKRAKLLLNDFEDLRKLGCYNDLYIGALAALTRAYQTFRTFQLCHGDTYDGSQTWRQRDDFGTLCEDLEIDKSSLANAASLINKKTKVPFRPNLN